ncbi:MAG: EpsI family protein [Candidatus Omnitrophica bacterium]|nr:EpsI family protein [Candidatus Omnitrophota bacterium]
MQITKSIIRDTLIIIAMLGAFAVVQLNPVEKTAPGEKIRLEQMIPREFPSYLPLWKSVSYDMSDYKDKWQSINELLVRRYYQRSREGVDFILEYSSDMRKNFSFHFPENCHRSGGNEVDFFEPLEIELSKGKVLKARLLFIKGMKGSVEEHDKLVAYWLVIDKKQYHKTFWIKVDQMLSGLLKQSKTGFLVRIDYTEGAAYSDEGLKRGKELIARFVRDLYYEFDPQARGMLFGEELL